MFHTPPIFIEEGLHTTAFFTIHQPKTLVIFVHGFNGKSVETWGKFPELIRTNDDFKYADVVFYGYDSVRAQANNSALKFYTSLLKLSDISPNKWGIERDFIKTNFRYNNILIVAHSLGAIVVRRALILAKTENKEWIKSCKMILFAPAHRGARIQKLVTESLPSIGKILTGLGFITIPILDDLKPNSVTLNNLLHDSLHLLKNKQGDFTIASQIIWANKEIIVHNEQFCKDPIPVLVEDKCHTTICKPDDTYLTPYQIVVNSLIALS